MKNRNEAAPTAGLCWRMSGRQRFSALAGPEFKVMAENPMGETLMATPALSERVLYIRTRGHLVAVRPSAI